jgi:hypothetical protein
VSLLEPLHRQCYNLTPLRRLPPRNGHAMKSCGQCTQMNPDDASFCSQCGTVFESERAAPMLESEETRLWRAFIGPQKAILLSLKKGWSWDRPDEYYLQQFKKFSAGGQPRFTLTWHWPAFLVDPFLWFLYRKMYLYALIYALGPVLSAYLTGDLTVGFVWRLMAGVSGNYIYYWHIKEHIAEIRKGPPLGAGALDEQVRDRGGVQTYVLWLGLVLYIMLFFIVVQVIREGPPPTGPLQPGKAKPTAVYLVL